MRRREGTGNFEIEFKMASYRVALDELIGAAPNELEPREGNRNGKSQELKVAATGEGKEPASQLQTDAIAQLGKLTKSDLI